MVVGYRLCHVTRHSVIRSDGKFIFISFNFLLFRHVTRQIGPDDDNGDDDAPRMRRGTRPLHQRPPYLMTSSTGEASRVGVASVTEFSSRPDDAALAGWHRPSVRPSGAVNPRCVRDTGQ